MEKVQQVGCRRTETFDLLAVELANGGDDRLFALAAAADIQEAAESDLVLAVLVDVWDPQLRLPEKGVVSAPRRSGVVRRSTRRSSRGRSLCRCCRRCWRRSLRRAARRIGAPALDEASQRHGRHGIALPQPPLGRGSASRLSAAPSIRSLVVIGSPTAKPPPRLTPFRFRSDVTVGLTVSERNDARRRCQTPRAEPAPGMAPRSYGVC